MSAPREAALIAGCGYVGQALALHLAARGVAVYALRRTPIEIAPGITSIALDLTKPLPDDNLPSDIDFVIYAASADRRDEAAYRRAYVAGPRNLMDGIARRGHRLRRWVSLSSTGVYGYTDGRWVDETSPTASSGTGAVLEEGERVVTTSGLPAIVLRLGGIYGPGRRNLIDRVRAGAAPCPSGPPQFTNRMHRDDIVAAIDHLLTLDEPESLYLGVDDDPADTATVVRWLAEAIGAPMPKVGLPSDGRPNKRCSNARLRASGFTFRYPSFREGYRQVLAELQGS